MLIQAVLDLHKSLWDARNNDVHRNSKAEAISRERQRLQTAIRNIYKHPPQLHPNYPSILEVHLEEHLRLPNKCMKEWVGLTRWNIKSECLRRLQEHYMVNWLCGKLTDEIPLVSITLAPREIFYCLCVMCMPLWCINKISGLDVPRNMDTIW